MQINIVDVPTNGLPNDTDVDRREMKIEKNEGSTKNNLKRKSLGEDSSSLAKVVRLAMEE